ncbi:hypothetical protein ALC53_01911, partial [Atta colombica]
NKFYPRHIIQCGYYFHMIFHVSKNMQEQILLYSQDTHFTGRAFLLNLPASSCQGLTDAKLSSAIISQTLLSAKRRSVANEWPRRTISDIAVWILHFEIENMLDLA